MQIAILGRQPRISLAELESLFGAENITPIGTYAALVQSDKSLPQARLGGTMKSARVLTRLEKTELEAAFQYLKGSIPENIAYLPGGKLQLGVSVYGFKAQKNWLLRQMLELKKIVRKEGRSVRIIENKSETLETAQVLYNKLTGPLGMELLLIKDGTDVIVAQTTAVQNIDDYAARDFERPKRDAFVGMLPPKLAQIMINLAVRDTDPSFGSVILDPFCGTGVVLQEAILMGFDVYGSDISPKMIDYTDINLKWLLDHPLNKVTPHTDDKRYYTLEKADATNHVWQPKPNFIVCETYLGKPLTSLPMQAQLEQIISEANDIAEGFLKNIAQQVEKGTRLAVALPAWSIDNTHYKQLKVLDHLTDLGYNRLDLVHAKKADLIYHRENQVVARELTILVRS